MSITADWIRYLHKILREDALAMRPPSWISEKVNNSELERAICTKFGGQMHHGHAEMTREQKSKPKVNSRDVIKRTSGT